MPPIPPGGANPYPLVSSILKKARVRVNDTAFGLQGNLLSDEQPYTEELLNLAWNWIQAKCAVEGIETFIREQILFGLPKASQPYDPAYQCWVTWEGCSDGQFQFEGPLLPGDLILPMKVEVRQAGTQNVFLPMAQSPDGLPGNINRGMYDWRTDGMYFYGWTQAMDMRVRYAALRDPLTLDPDVPVPIVACEDAMSARLAFEFANFRGAPQASQMASMADDAFDKISRKQGRKNSRRTIRRRPFSARSRGGYAWPS